MANRELTQKEILEKDFGKKVRGYDPKEVDEFLDIIIKDYKAFESDIAELKAENERLINKLDELSKQQTVKSQNQSQNGSSVTNFDILKRLSNLERHVFGSKLDDE